MITKIPSMKIPCLSSSHVCANDDDAPSYNYFQHVMCRIAAYASRAGVHALSNCPVCPRDDFTPYFPSPQLCVTSPRDGSTSKKLHCYNHSCPGTSPQNLVRK